MTLGTGALIAMSTKQKLNTTSSTEAELVGVSESTPFNMWATYIFKAQGRVVSKYNLGKRNMLLQDNGSCIKLANNGKASSSRRARHINIRYFFDTDRVKNKEIEIYYCTTKEMIEGFFTKSLQFTLFIRFRNSILGITAKDYRQHSKDDYYIQVQGEQGVRYVQQQQWIGSNTGVCVVVSLQDHRNIVCEHVRREDGARVLVSFNYTVVALARWVSSNLPTLRVLIL